MFKRILLSLAIIGTVGSSAVVGTRALLSDPASITENTFSVGSLDLQISKTNSNYDSISITGFSGTLYPNQTQSNEFYLKNVSDITVNVSGQAFDLGGTLPGTDMTISIQPLDLGGSPVGSPVSGNYSAWLSGAQALPALTAGQVQRYRMDVTIGNITTGGQNAHFNMNFVATQQP